jgi:predicted dehydrogenase
LEARPLNSAHSTRKLALVGTGQVARGAHLPVFARVPGLSVVAIADRDCASLSAAHALVPQARMYPSLGELLRAEEVDIVDICTPPAFHAPLILEALQAGAHVLCEKPLVLDPEDLEEIRDRALRVKKIVYSVHNWKFAPQFLTVQRWIQEGLIGQLLRIELHTLRKAPAFASNQTNNSWRLDAALAGGGVLADHGWHLFSLVLGLSGEAPRSVWARLGREKFTSSVLEDTAFCQVSLESVKASLFMSWAENERRNTGVIHGDRGTIFLDDDRLWASPAGRLEVFAEALSAGSSHPEWFELMLSDFLKGLDRPVPASNLEEAASCLALLTSAYESGRQGSRAIEIKRRQAAAIS